MADGFDFAAVVVITRYGAAQQPISAFTQPL